MTTAQVRNVAVSWSRTHAGDSNYTFVTEHVRGCDPVRYGPMTKCEANSLVAARQRSFRAVTKPDPYWQP